MARQARPWSYWTVNKLEILSGYLPAFNTASVGRASERIYIDLMAGRPGNVERHTGDEIHGSARRALQSSPGFTRHVFCELPDNAHDLERDLRLRFPGSSFDVVSGDCNETIDQVLHDLRAVSWAPTFVFADQQAAEIHWTTIEKISRFKSGRTKTKAEVWMLMSPVMIARGVSGTNNESFRERVTNLYGNDDWLRIQSAKDDRIITPQQYRSEMVNLIRYQLSEHLGYAVTHRIPMRMPNGTEIYDMVFATDHYAGDNIMRSLYKAAAQREPKMRAEAIRLAKERRIEDTGQLTLVDLPRSDAEASGADLWLPDEHWLPSSRNWW